MCYKYVKYVYAMLYLKLFNLLKKDWTIKIKKVVVFCVTIIRIFFYNVHLHVGKESFECRSAKINKKKIQSENQIGAQRGTPPRGRK